jgi:hypothetical protein
MKGLRLGPSLAALAISTAMAVPLAAQPLPPTTGPVAIDADPVKWGDVVQAPRTGGVFDAGTVGSQYVWTDVVGDALGNGSYTEATNENITFGQADIEEFRFAYDEDNLYFYARVNDDQTFFGAFGCRLAVYLERSDLSGGSSTAETGAHALHNQSPKVAFGDGFQYNFHLSNRGGYADPHFYDVASDAAHYGTDVVKEAENQTTRVVEMSVPWSAIGGYPAFPIDLRLVVGAGGPDGDIWRFVGETAGEFNHGGGCSNGDLNSRLIDLIGEASDAEQFADLTPPDCSGSQVAMITNSIITIPLAIESDLPFAPLQAIEGPLTLDGDPSKWGTHAFGANEGGPVTDGIGPQYVWKDAADDDTGNGSYTYPTNGEFKANAYDIDEFRFAFDLENAYFLVTMNGDQNFFGAYGARVGIWVDRSDINSGSDTTDIGDHKNFCQAPDAAFFEGFNWDFHVSNRGGFQSAYLYRVSDNASFFPGGVQEFENVGTRTVEIAVPWADIGGLPSDLTVLRMVVGAGSEDGGGNWREVLGGAPGEWNFGGGCTGNDDEFNTSPCLFDGDADLLDLIGAAQVDQEADLTSADCVAYTLPVVSNSVVTVPIVPPAAMVPLTAGTYYDNSYIRFRFSSPATGATVTDTANYTITNANPDNVTVEEVGFGPVSGTDFVWLRLSRPLTQDDIDAGVSIAFSDDIRSDGNVPIASGSTLPIPSVLFIVPVTIDASGDPQEFLAPPYMVGAWDDFNFRHLIRDGDDAYPNIPFSTVEAGDTPDDGIYLGRVWTSTDPFDANFAVKSDYDFAGFNEPGTAAIRALSVGYWMKYNYDPIYRGEGFINLTKPHQSRLIAEPVTVNFTVDVLDDGFNFTPADVTGGAVVMYLQSGVTFGPENAIPTDPPSTIPGDRDVPDGLELTYQGTMVVEGESVMRFTGEASYPVGVPDVSGFRLGYTYDDGVTVTTVREEPPDALGAKFDIIQPPDNAIDYQNTSVHLHVARLVEDDGFGGTVGRTLRMVFQRASLDIVPPPANGLTAPPQDPDVLGDLNADGVINVADVTELANLIADGNPPANSLGDINGDESVNEADVEALAAQIVND